MEATAEAILRALSKAGLDDEPLAIVGALGSVVDCIAAASNDPPAMLAAIVRMAEGVISSDLLDPHNLATGRPP